MKTITNELKNYINEHHEGGYNDWHNLKYDGRKRMFKGISRAEFAEAKEKHIHRLYIRLYINDSARYMKSDLRRAYETIREWAKPEHGSYQKVAVYGNRHLWLCSPIHGHRDYNKSRLLEVAGHEKQCEWLIKVSERISGIITM